MTNVVDRVSRNVTPDCRATRCRKEGCSLGLNNAPSPHVLIDMDHPDAPIGPNESKCDYIFIGETVKPSWFLWS